ncbi:MAG: DUF503 domain-containing protein [Acidobacteriota bacterium]
MITGIMKIEMFSRDTHSLKEKRRIVLSIKEKLKNRYNISIIESGFQNTWKKIEISVAMVSNSRSYIQKIFDQIEEFIFSNYPVEIIKADIEFV